MTSDEEPRNLRPRPPDDWLDEMRRRFPEHNADALATILRLVNLGRAVTGTITPYFREIELTEARFTLVMMIYRLEWKLGFATPSQLAQHAGIGKAAMTQMLDGLAEAGWIDREAHAQDRRKLAVRLTPSGKRRLERFLPEHFERMRLLTSALSAQELKILNGIATKLEDGLARIDMAGRRRR
jgi:DNA-binding MarR family transcriptional regulator